MPCLASSSAVAFSWNTTACSSIFLQCPKKIECTRNGHKWHEETLNFHPHRTFISKPFPPFQDPHQVTTLKVHIQKSLSNSIGASSSDTVVFGHYSSGISLQCSKTLRVHQMDIREGTYYLCRTFISKPYCSLANNYCINFGTGSSDELPTWALQCPKAFRVYRMGIFDIRKSYTLSTQIFHFQNHPTLSQSC